jgi:hypothetical protein
MAEPFNKRGHSNELGNTGRIKPPARGHKK